MNVSLSRIFSAAVNLCIAASVLNSCVNEAYDLNNVDGTAVIFKDAAMPIGNIEALDVSKLIATDDASVIAADPVSGDFSFRFNGTDLFSESLVIPTFEIPFTDGNSNHQTLTFDLSEFSRLDGTHIPPAKIEFHREFSRAFEIEDSHLLPHEVLDVDHVELDMDIEYIFKVSTGCAYVKPGFVMDFPDWMVVEKCDNRTDYVVETQGINKNVVRFTSDLKIGSTKDEVLDLKISAINLPDGAIVDAGNDSEGRPCKKINIDDENSANKIIAAGDVYVQTSDFPVIPEEAELKMHLEFSNFDIKSAEAKINMTTTVPDKEFPVVDYPDFFTMEGVVMDIYNPEIVFDFVNSLDVDFSFSADINAYKNSEQKVTAHIGGESDFIIPADKSSEIVISRSHIKNLGEILKVLPDNIMISNMLLSSKDKSSPDEYSTLKPGHQFSCSVAYALRAALAFGPDFCLPYSMDINDLGEAFSELGLKSANLLMTVENTIPLNFAITSAALDESGNPKNDVTIEVNGNVPSGTLDSPSANTLGIKISTTADALELNTLRLNMTATCPSAQHQGVPLNENQGLHIKSLAISLPDGITMDLNK